MGALERVAFAIFDLLPKSCAMSGVPYCRYCGCFANPEEVIWDEKRESCIHPICLEKERREIMREDWETYKFLTANAE